MASSAQLRQATTYFLAGALVELLTWWIDSKSRLEPAELDEIFRRLSRPVLKQLART